MLWIAVGLLLDCCWDCCWSASCTLAAELVAGVALTAAAEIVAIVACLCVTGGAPPGCSDSVMGLFGTGAGGCLSVDIWSLEVPAAASTVD